MSLLNDKIVDACGREKSIAGLFGPQVDQERVETPNDKGGYQNSIIE